MVSSHWAIRRVREVVPPWTVLAAVATVMATVAVWNFSEELSEFGPVLPVLAAFALNLLLSVIVASLALFFRRGAIRRDDAWLVTVFALGGGLLMVVAESVTLGIRMAEGRPVAEPQFPVLVVGGIGIVGGVVVGRQYVRLRQSTREIEQARDAMAFTNDLLRHDVRNGLQVIDANASVLVDSGDEVVRERAEAIRSQSDAVESLLTEVQSVSAVLTDDIEQECLALAPLLSEVVEATRQSYPRATVDLDCPSALSVKGSEALEPVFSNLLTNAVQHVGEDVNINVTAESSGETVTVRVADDGPGIPPGERDRVFDQDVSSDGGGQGLYVADTIVDRLGGDIIVEESQWSGAAFVVELPAGDGP